VAGFPTFILRFQVARVYVFIFVFVIIFGFLSIAIALLSVLARFGVGLEE
jgi:hypothetical protein